MEVLKGYTSKVRTGVHWWGLDLLEWKHGFARGHTYFFQLIIQKLNMLASCHGSFKS